MSTLTWITEEELEREVKKAKETNFVGRITSKFYSDGEKCEILAELANTKVKMSGSQKKEQEHIQRFLHKTCNWEVSGQVSRCGRAKQRQRNQCTKNCPARAKLLLFSFSAN